MSATDFAKREEAYRANNRGVARLEQFEPAYAIPEFREALAKCPDVKIAQVNLAIALLYAQKIDEARVAADQAVSLAPESLSAHYVQALIARNQDRTEAALAGFQYVLKADPSDVGANVNVGQIYAQQRNNAEAIVYFRRAYAAEPYNSSAIYNLATALIRNDERDEGQKLIGAFQELRKSGAATSIGQNYLEQGRYAEALVSTGAEPELVAAKDPTINFRVTPTTIKTAAAVVALTDFDNDGDPDIVQIDPASRRRLFRNDEGQFVDISTASGELTRPSTLKVTGVLSGDINNDLFDDLLMFGNGRPAYLKGNGKGGYSDLSSKLPVITGQFSTGALVDVDHDGDLDILLLGTSTKLLRNNGDGTFVDKTTDAKIGAGTHPVAVIPTDFDNRRDVDLLVLNSGDKPRLYQNLRDSTFRNVADEVGLGRPGKWTVAAAGDVNKDTYIDFFFGREAGPGLFAVSDGKGKFTLSEAPRETVGSSSAQFADFDNDGLLDLVAGTNSGAVLIRNLGRDWAVVGGDKTGLPGRVGQLVSADLDRDGNVDILSIAKGQPVQFYKNLGTAANGSISVSLQGRVSNRTAVGAKVDLRSGSLSQKLETYAASPMPAAWGVHFGLGRREQPDAVRVLWPSGVVQAEMDIAKLTAANRRDLSIEELDRKPSSCPYLYTWDGEKFAFVTDFLGGGEMGNWKDRGAYHFPDSDEFVRIPPKMLRPRNGRYELRVTNELEEVMFLDHLKLVAIEHTADSEIYPNEGYGIPTAGTRVIYTTRGEQPPATASDSTGKNVLAKIKDLDYTFYDSFTSTPIRGYAETHSLTMTLDQKKGFKGRTLLLLTGWTDYAFSSDNLAASQSGKALFFPKLQVKDAGGEWQTVVDSIGISVGRPQTIVADLTGKFLTDSREVRIVTNVKTYWDKIAVDTSQQQEVKAVELMPVQADLTERGFSAETSYAGMLVPTYDKILDDGRWKFFTGRFTRTGSVLPLLRTTDDVFVISKTGDELILSFTALPEPAPGRKYTFLLYADGYSKEMDINSGSPDAVYPLPFKGMSKYPYASPEQFPMTDEKQRIYDEYTTRVGRRLLPQIEAGLIQTQR
ncbi:MAG: FG-GAP-like repeat-containing protein [Pyrinomonadaceae bacterium]